MEIESGQTQPPLKGQRRAQASLDTSTDLPIGADPIDTSEPAGELAPGQQSVQGTPKSRSEKVAQIKRSIENGTYIPPVALLAQKLLEGRSDGR
jgi:anti-sigma28 factor (negative regulator of flagellin synthesis)